MTTQFIHSQTGLWIRAARIFIISAAAILVLTDLAKLTTSTGNARILDRADAVFWFMTNRQLLLAVALLEIGIAAAILSKRLDLTNKLFLIAWLGSVFLIYRGVRAWTGDHGPCGCVGNLTEALGISAGAADLGMKIMLAYLLAGSMAFLAMALLIRGKTIHSEGLIVREQSVPKGI